jgi:hypothetical protein
MSLPKYSAGEKSLPVESDMEASNQSATASQRIRATVGQLSSNSIDVLKELTCELQEVQRFLDSEVQRVQGDINNALAGIKIIIDTIGPWKSSPVSLATPTPRGR